MLLPWPEEQNIKVFPNETQQALATINRCLIRLLDNDRFLYNKITINAADVVTPSGNVVQSTSYLRIIQNGISGDEYFLMPLYKYQ